MPATTDQPAAQPAQAAQYPTAPCRVCGLPSPVARLTLDGTCAKCCIEQLFGRD